tara:strand:- start:652 stop:1038 length:387 start_codon:yes stop_codon:yes gene_type:complete
LGVKNKMGIGSIFDDFESQKKKKAKDISWWSHRKAVRQTAKKAYREAEFTQAKARAKRKAKARYAGTGTFGARLAPMFSGVKKNLKQAKRKRARTQRRSSSARSVIKKATSRNIYSSGGYNPLYHGKR